MKFDRSHLLFAAVSVIWGTTWIALKIGVTAVPPILYAGTRFVTAGAALLVLLRLQGGAMRIARADIGRFAAVTLLMIVAAYALLFWGATFVSTGLAAILDLAFMPTSLLVIGALLGEDRFTPWRAVGVAIGVVGLVMLFGPKAFAGVGAGGAMEVFGGGAIVVSALIYALGSVLARPLLRRYSPMLVSGVTTFAGGAVLLGGALWLEPGARAAMAGRWGLPAWLGWGFLVLFGSLVAYTAFLVLVREWGAARAGAYAFVSPIIAVALGVAVFGETVSVMDACGMAVMLAGAWLTLRPVP